MRKINPMLLIDFYKAVHAEMLPKGITKSVSYFTPRMTRVKRWDKVVMFGLQGFIKTYLIDYFNEEFFNKPFDEVIADYKRIMDASLGENVYGIKKIEELHKLGYLPIKIIALPEGTLVPMHVPMFGITNTHPDFAWLPQALESLISAESWHPMLAATVGYTYRQIVNKYYDLTCDDNVALGVGSFSFQCIEEDGILKPFTRDTFSSCIKATYCEINGKPVPIFKNPKDGGFKKSQKGCCIVNSDLTFTDGHTWAEAYNENNMLQPIFSDGKMIKEYSLAEVRNTLHGGKF